MGWRATVGDVKLKIYSIYFINIKKQISFRWGYILRIGWGYILRIPRTKPKDTGGFTYPFAYRIVPVRRLHETAQVGLHSARQDAQGRRLADSVGAEHAQNMAWSWRW